MTLRKFFLILISSLLLPIPASQGADILYDTLAEPVHTNGNFSEGVWLGISFRTSETGYVLDSISVPIRNPNLLTGGSIAFTVFDATGPNSLPGVAVGAPLGSKPILGISAISYETMTLTGLNRTLAKNTNYWLIVGSSGLSAPYYIGATSSAAGTTPGSLGFTMSVDLGLNWNAASTANYGIGRIVAVPEPSTCVLGAIAVLAGGIASRRKHRPLAVNRPD